jgi:hypothetical protein
MQKRHSRVEKSKKGEKGICMTTLARRLVDYMSDGEGGFGNKDVQRTMRSVALYGILLDCVFVWLCLGIVLSAHRDRLISTRFVRFVPCNFHCLRHSLRAFVVDEATTSRRPYFVG